VTAGNDTDTNGHVPWNWSPSLTGRARTEDGAGSASAPASGVQSR
jgi:hypothetical protein